MYYKLKTTLKVLFILELMLGLMSFLLYVYLFHTQTDFWFLGSIYRKEFIFYSFVIHTFLSGIIILMVMLYPKLYDVVLPKIKKIIYALLLTIYLGMISIYSLIVFFIYVFGDNRYHSFNAIEDTEILLVSKSIFGSPTQLYQIHDHMFIREVKFYGLPMGFDETYFRYEIHMNEIGFDIEFKYTNQSRFYSFYIEEGILKPMGYTIG